MAKRDYRSAEAQAYRRLYNLAIWRGKGGLRDAQLAKQPLCERCLKRKRVVPAMVANHKTPHKGDWSLFADPQNLESTCAPCHDGEVQSEEALGFSKAIGADGWPIDAKHPANARGQGVADRPL